MGSHKDLLGPILFTIFVYNISDHINDCILVPHADGKQFTHSVYISNLDQIITRAKITLSNANTSFLKCGLMLNSNKTQLIFTSTQELLSRKPDDIPVNFDRNKLPISKHIKIFGIYFDMT